MPEVVQSLWNLLELSAREALAAALIILVGATISGLTGFGFGLVVVPVLLLIFPPATVIILTTALAVASSLPILAQDYRHVRARLIMPLLIPALIGQLAGVRLLTGLDTRYIKAAAGAVVVVFAVLVARGFVIPGIKSKLAPLVAGSVSGLLGTSTGMSGPPVVLFLTDRTPEPRVFRASITFYFFVVNLAVIGLVSRTGLVGKREAALASILLPVALTGRRMGQALLHRVSPEQFRRFALGLLVLTGASGALTALLGLF